MADHFFMFGAIVLEISSITQSSGTRHSQDLGNYVGVKVTLLVLTEIASVSDFFFKISCSGRAVSI
jgi:hypothetical protein